MRRLDFPHVLAARSVLREKARPMPGTADNFRTADLLLSTDLVARPHGAHGPFPVRALQPQRRRLHRALDQQAAAGPPLRGAGDFLSAPEQVELLVADEALIA